MNDTVAFQRHDDGPVTTTGLGRPLLVCGLLLFGATAAGSVGLWRVLHPLIPPIALGQACVYAVAAFLVVRAPPRGQTAIVVILALGMAMRALLILAPPVSTDLYRYIWDGRVAAHGINPYLYVPADPHLAFLRDDAIFPRINRADYAPTIYPSAAQMVFWAVTRVSESVAAMKLAMVAFEGVTVWALLRLLARFGKPAPFILLYAWHPLPLWEFAGSGHVDAVSIAFATVAMLAAASGRALGAGVALGLATLVKFWPVVLAPALYRRWGWRMPLGFLLTLAVCYAPYLSAGSALFGFLGGYADEEGLRSGAGLYPWALAGRVIPLPATSAPYLALAAVIMAGLGLKVLFRREQRLDSLGALLLATAWTVLLSPHYPWYFAWLVPFICILPSAAVVYLTGFSSLLYVIGWPLGLGGQSLLYGPFVVILIVEALVRHGRKEKRNERPLAVPPAG